MRYKVIWVNRGSPIKKLSLEFTEKELILFYAFRKYLSRCKRIRYHYIEEIP